MTLRALLESFRGRRYDEAVDELTHALQTARHARDAGADDEVIVAAALHDAGRIPAVAATYPGLPHEESGAAFVAQLVSDRAACLVRAHVPAKRYLVATDASYAAKLSPASVGSLARQGGPMSEEEIAAFERAPDWESALALRRWDDAAKDPDAPHLPLDEVVERYERLRATG